MSGRSPEERQVVALERIAKTLSNESKSLDDIKSKLTSLTTAVRRRSNS